MRDDEFERLRAHYARLEKQAPGANVDDAIRAAARRATTRVRLRVWGAALASAACVGLAVVLVPALLIESPAPGMQDREGKLLITVKRESAEREAAESRRNAMREPMPMAAPALAAPEPPRPQARQRMADDAGMGGFAAEQGNRAAVLEALRAELENATEATWRSRLLALRAAGQEPLANTLLADFRERFGRPADFTFDDLAAEAKTGPDMQD